MTKAQILERGDRILSVPPNDEASVEQIFNGALTLMTAVYGENSQQVKGLVQRREHIMKTEKGYGWIGPLRAGVEGCVTNLIEEVEGGFLGSVERRIVSDVLSDLVQLARAALDESTEGSKSVAAVLAAAAYEDTIRRIAREHAGVIGQDRLDSVIGKLKDAGLLVAPQLGIALSFLNFRNHALHAEWDKIDRASVTSVLGFVQELLLKHFS